MKRGFEGRYAFQNIKDSVQISEHDWTGYDEEDRKVGWKWWVRWRQGQSEFFEDSCW